MKNRLWLFVGGNILVAHGDSAVLHSARLWLMTVLFVGTGFDLLAVSLYSWSTAITYIVGLPLIAVLLDRVDKIRVMYVAQIGMGIAVLLGVVAVFVTDMVSAFVVLSMILIVAAVLAMSSIAADLSGTVILRKAFQDHLGSVIGTLKAGTALGRTIGPTLGIMVFATIGMAGVFGVRAVVTVLVLAAIYLAVKLFGPSMRRELAAPVNADRLTVKAAIAENIAGIRYLFGHRLLRWSTIQYLLLMFLAGSFVVVLVFITVDSHGHDRAVYGFAAGAYAAGSIIGGLASAALTDRLATFRYLVAGGPVITVTVFLVVTSGEIWLLLAAACAFGVVTTFIESDLSVAQLRVIEDQYVSRALASIGLLTNLAMLLSVSAVNGVVAVGPLVDLPLLDSWDDYQTGIMAMTAVLMAAFMLVSHRLVQIHRPSAITPMPEMSSS